jgi:hypothetical protein
VFDYDAVGSNDPLGSASVSVTNVLTQTLEGQKPYPYEVEREEEEKDVGKEEEGRGRE